MSQYWLKPFGTTEPPRRIDPDWTIGADLDNFMIITGPATPRKPPQMGAGDRILFHAAGHVRLYAAGELIGLQGTTRNSPSEASGVSSRSETL
jgi:hypothetical protein